MHVTEKRWNVISESQKSHSPKQSPSGIWEPCLQEDGTSTNCGLICNNERIDSVYRWEEGTELHGKALDDQKK